MNNFPINPKNGDIFEYKKGLIFQYDMSVNSWLPLTVNSLAIDLATVSKSGAMSHIDLRKLNRLVLPFPQASITSEDCDTTFETGSIDLKSADKFIQLDGNVEIRNIDEFGENITTTEAYHIHQNTYGFDFRMELSNLMAELISRNQITLRGATGEKGDVGDEGDKGISFVMAGPKGYKGETGDIIECNVEIESEPIPMDPLYRMSKAFVAARVIDHPTDNRKFKLELDRQTIGLANRAATQFNIGGFGSFWIMAVASSGGAPQYVYHIDVEPLIESIHNKFLQQMELLKSGYESIVKHWVQTMSDMFDEQKAALCCALENCISKTKNTDLRQHMENVAASAIPDAKIKIRPNGNNTDKKVIPGTARTKGKDCSTTEEAQAVQIESPFMQNQQLSLLKVEANQHTINKKNALRTYLQPGKYHAIINNTDAKINNIYGHPIKIIYSKNNKETSATFLDKGQYTQLKDAKSAYEGLSLSFIHDGGDVYLYYPKVTVMSTSGSTDVEFIKINDITPKDEYDPSLILNAKSQDDYFISKFTVEDLNNYTIAYNNKKGVAISMEISGQEYILLRKKMKAAGILKFANNYKSIPAIALPTFDGKNLLPVESDIDYCYNINHSQAVINNINNKRYKLIYGNPSNITYVLFPLISE